MSVRNPRGQCGLRCGCFASWVLAVAGHRRCLSTATVATPYCLPVHYCWRLIADSCLLVLMAPLAMAVRLIAFNLRPYSVGTTNCSPSSHMYIPAGICDSELSLTRSHHRRRWLGIIYGQTFARSLLPGCPLCCSRSDRRGQLANMATSLLLLLVGRCRRRAACSDASSPTQAASITAYDVTVHHPAASINHHIGHINEHCTLPTGRSSCTLLASTISVSALYLYGPLTRSSVRDDSKSQARVPWCCFITWLLWRETTREKYFIMA